MCARTGVGECEQQHYNRLGGERVDVQGFDTHAAHTKESGKVIVVLGGKTRRIIV